MPGNENSSQARLPSVLEISNDNMAAKWKLWKQTFDFYAIATQLSTKPPEIQTATFMSAIGQDAIVVFNTFGLTAIEEQDLTVIKQKFDEHFAPTPNETYVRYLFFNCSQMEYETFDVYLTKLRTKVNDCNFNCLQDSLMRDQIVRGIRSDKVRELLLSERELSLNKAIDICRASEQATVQLKEMQAVTGIKEKDILSLRDTKRVEYKKDNFEKFANQEKRECWRCGLEHGFRRNCPAFNVTCRKCKKKGHWERQCNSRKKKFNETKHKTIFKLEESVTDDDNDVDAQRLCTHDCNTLQVSELLKSPKDSLWFTVVKFNNGISVRFKLDTGAEGNVITADVARKLGEPILKSGVQRLKSFNNEYTPVVGEIITKCDIENKTATLKFLVVDGKFNCILGCNACEQLGLIKRNDEFLEINEVGIKIPEKIFQGIGCIKNFEYDIELQDAAPLVIHPPRRIPYAIRDTVKAEIALMVKMKILTPVTHPTPAVSPLVIVKKGEKIRLCLDPTDINKAIKRCHFPLKTVEDIAARIGSAKYFTILDAKKGFWQLRVTKRTSDYLTVNTPWGRYSFLRVPFGLASAPEIFQQVMQSILHGFRNTECSMDDILIWADTPQELSDLTINVVNQLLKHGVRLNKEKCEFRKTRVKFLGHIFTSEGIEIDDAKIKAIENLKTPTCLVELQRFLGMVNYISKFIPNFSSISEPLRRLLHKDVLWEWSTDQDNAFCKLKDALRNTPKLAYYDVNKPVVVSVDASSHAVGAVLLQEGRPIAYSTKALSPAQQRYPQIEKEAFAIRHGCKKFHDYIYGKSVIVETDHKPLEAIAKKPLQSAPPRLQRILFDVIQYVPKIVYKRGTQIPIPDTLSRDCVPDSAEDSCEEIETFEVAIDVPIPLLTFSQLIAAVNEDEELQDLKCLILEGWPNDIGDVHKKLRKYWNYREELSVYDGLLFKADRLIVPSILQPKYLKLIHQGHLGINLSLYFAREFVFWHGMSRDIELYVRQCSVCQQTSRAPDTEPLIMKPVPRYPWQRVASDLFAFAGNCYCLLVDSYSGYFDFVKLKEPTSDAVINYLKDSFAVHGIPDFLESDNGSQYTSLAFKNFTRSWKINHVTSSPLYPKSNGLAERYVQVAKLILKRCLLDRSDYRLALLNWRNTPRENLPSPAQRLFCRRTRTLIPLHPEIRAPRVRAAVPLQSVREKQRLASTASVVKKAPSLQKGQVVKFKTSPRNWVPATVQSKCDSPRSYLVTTADGNVYRRNTEVLQPTLASIPPERHVVVRSPRTTSTSKPSSQVGVHSHLTPQAPESSGLVMARSPPPSPGSSSLVPASPVTPNRVIRSGRVRSLHPTPGSSSLVPAFPVPPKRVTRSGRVTRPPDRLDL